MIAAFPVTMSTAIVSPMARPIPRMIAALMPESAAGTITLRTVCQWFAPRARLPSLNSRGTELMASSATLVIVGMAMIARRIEPASQLDPEGWSKAMRIQSVRRIRPKNPYTTEGMPASSSTAGLMTAFVRGPAISAM